MFEVAKAIYGPGSEVGEQWAKQRRKELDAGRVDDVIGALRSHAENCEEARKDAEYFSTNRERMNYRSSGRWACASPPASSKGAASTSSAPVSSAAACAGPSPVPTPSSRYAAPSRATGSMTSGNVVPAHDHEISQMGRTPMAMTPEAWTVIGTGLVILIAIAASNRQLRTETESDPCGNRPAPRTHGEARRAARGPARGHHRPQGRLNTSLSGQRRSLDREAGPALRARVRCTGGYDTEPRQERADQRSREFLAPDQCRKEHDDHEQTGPHLAPATHTAMRAAMDNSTRFHGSGDSRRRLIRAVNRSPRSSIWEQAVLAARGTYPSLDSPQYTATARRS